MSRHYIYLLTIIIVSCLHVSLAFASPQDSLRTVSKEGTKYIEYVVSPGETVYGISTKYNISISRLMEVNPELENGLKSGQLILIPLSEVIHQPVVNKQSSDFENPNLSVHTVAPGETLYSLSKKYDVSVGDLLKWNGMELRAGQQLVVGYKSKGESAPEIEESEEEEEDAPEAATLDNKPKENKPNREREEPQKADVHIYTSTDVRGEEYRVYDFDTNMKQVLIVPFDPHLYFSDADDEIAEVSRIPRIKVREVFRRRLNVLLAPRGYESIYLLGGKSKDTLSDLNKIYGSVTYNYQDVLYSDSYMQTLAEEEEENKATASADEKVKDWIKKTRDKLADPQNDKQAHREKFKGKYFGVRVTDPRFFDYFDRKYSIDYYIFINQFEVITDYEHCLDRSVGNYKRYFIAHFSIFDRDGNQIAGNKFRVDYDSNSNDIHKICGDNMIKIADRVLRELPPPDREY